MKQNQAEHDLIFNTVKSILDRVVPHAINLLKNSIATQCAIQLKEVVRVKQRDEE